VKTTLAACLEAVALLSLIGFVAHTATIPLPSEYALRPGHQESILGLVAFISGLLATAMSRSLRSPARQVILVSGGLLTVLSMMLWIGVAATM